MVGPLLIKKSLQVNIILLIKTNISSNKKLLPYKSVPNLFQGLIKLCLTTASLPNLMENVSLF